jgi:hypothetical protein
MIESSNALSRCMSPAVFGLILEAPLESCCCHDHCWKSRSGQVLNVCHGDVVLTDRSVLIMLMPLSGMVLHTGRPPARVVCAVFWLQRGGRRFSVAAVDPGPDGRRRGGLGGGVRQPLLRWRDRVPRGQQPGAVLLGGWPHVEARVDAAACLGVLLGPRPRQRCGGQRHGVSCRPWRLPWVGGCCRLFVRWQRS